MSQVELLAEPQGPDWEYINPVRDRRAWLAARGQGIGGSDAGVLMRWNPYKGVGPLWEEKVGLRDSDFEPNRFIEWGNLLEPVILRKYAAEEGVWVLGRDHAGHPVRFPPTMDRHPHYIGERHPLARWLTSLVSPSRDFARANVDGFDLGPDGRWPVAALEVKNTGQDNGPKWEWYPPPMYLAQCLHNREVLREMGLDIPFRIMVLIGGNRYGWLGVGEHRQYVEELRARESYFWHCVKTTTKPSVRARFPRVPTPDELEEMEMDMGGFAFPSDALGKGSNIPLCPTGTHLGICVGVVDRGMEENKFDAEKGERHRMSVHWIFPDELIPEVGTDGRSTEDLAGRPYMLSQFFTVSLHERSSFRAFLKTIRGRDINEADEEQVKAGTWNPAEFLIGTNAGVTVIHKEKQDKTLRADISSVAPLMKGMPARPIPEDFIDWEPGKNRKDDSNDSPSGFDPTKATASAPAAVGSSSDDEMPF